MPGHVLMVVQTSPLVTSPAVVKRLVSVADQLAHDVTAVIFRRRIWTSEVGQLLQDMDQRVQTLQRTYDAEAEQLAEVCASAAAQAGLALQISEIDLNDDPIEALATLARSHDYCVLPVGDTVEDELDILAALLYRAGRAVVLTPDSLPSPPAPRWERAVVAWTPSGQAARAMKDAVPLLLKAKAVSVLAIREDATEFDPARAMEAVQYLKSRGVSADINSVPAAGQPVGGRIAQFMDEKAADLLVMGAPSKPFQADFKLHSKAIDVIDGARWVIMISA
ncbi:MAG TPA: universal stress protein [Phenylobacterium sp.]|jgi:nucleotide-binding universal stress UspA family protein